MKTKNTTPEAVSVIGLGNMGTALAEAFMKAGITTTVWNRTPGKAEMLVSKGANLAATPMEAVQASPMVVACVLEYSALYKIIEQAKEVLKDGLISMQAHRRRL